MLCFIATMQSKPSLVGVIAPWTSILQLKTSLASRPKFLRKGPPLIWTFFSWLLSLFGETKTMPFTMMLAALQLKFGRLQNDPWLTSPPPTYMINPLTPQSELIGLHPLRVFTKLMLMGQQQMTENTLVSELLSETTRGPLLELSTSYFRWLFLVLSPRLLLCTKSPFCCRNGLFQGYFWVWCFSSYSGS